MALAENTTATDTHVQTAGMSRLHKIIFTVMLVALLALPFFVYPVFAMKVMCFALFAAAFNLLLGFGGLLSFGHAAYFGGASYIAAHAAKVWGLTPELSVLCGAAAAGVLGLAIGSLAIKRQGIYFAMVTLAFAQMIYFVALQAPFTGGEGILLLYRIVHSPFGAVLKAIRENEPRAISLGYDVNRYKLIVFTLSATMSGVAGATKAQVFQLASLTDVHWSMSGEVVLMTLLGGMGTIFGPLVGAAMIVTMQNYLATFGAWVTIIQGVIFVIGVLMFREGIVGVLSRWFKRPL